MAQLRARVAQLEARVAELAPALEQRTAQLEERSAQLAESSVHLATSRRALASSQTQLATSRTQLDSTYGQLWARSAELADANTRLVELQEQCRHEADTNWAHEQALREEAERAGARAKALKRRLKAAQRTIDRQRMEYNDLYEGGVGPCAPY